MISEENPEVTPPWIEEEEWKLPANEDDEWKSVDSEDDNIEKLLSGDMPWDWAVSEWKPS